MKESDVFNRNWGGRIVGVFDTLPLDVPELETHILGISCRFWQEKSTDGFTGSLTDSSLQSQLTR